ncbi:MAG: hypothetical protein R6W77_06035 [Trueperaceae bacterium]
MIEDSVDAFVTRWRGHAAEVELFPRHEGSPLLECRAGTALLQLFERTGPYLWRPGPGRVIIHPITEALEVIAEDGADGHHVWGSPAADDETDDETSAGSRGDGLGRTTDDGEAAAGSRLGGSVSTANEAVPSLEVDGVSRMQARGRVVEREGQFLVVDAGVPLVVGVQGAVPEQAVPGAWVRFRNVAPMHGFVLDDERRRRATERPDDAI